MRKYVGVKKIEAEPMTRGEYNEFRGWTIPEDENPEDAGYFVKYSDGYISWSPKKQFEEAYREVTGEPELPETALGMISSDYKERFRAEHAQLKIRYEKLKEMLRMWDDGALTFVPTCPRSIYTIQIKSMFDYMAVLEERAKMEGIEL